MPPELTVCLGSLFSLRAQNTKGSVLALQGKLQASEKLKCPQKTFSGWEEEKEFIWQGRTGGAVTS